MKRLVTVLALLVMVLGALVPQAIMAQGPEPARAPRPEKVPSVPVQPKPDWGGVWTYGPSMPTPFQARIDAGYFPDDALVYFMGGRMPDNFTSGEVWYFDPATGTYSSTGALMVDMISNYTMNLLQDANGDWGFYVVCGRPDAGGTTNSVQVYYPVSNTVVMLDPADDFPGPGCTSAMNQVYDNKVYVAGGFDPGQTPSNWDYTYTFDPQAPVGSKWTLLTATLSISRAYIMSAVIDDMIYAIGGSWFDGAALINVQTVEVLDPNDPNGDWDDAAVADLPVECSESRAFGFDVDSPYRDPDGTPLAGKIVSGCGWWGDPNNEVYIYDTALDFWDAFPFLNEARRSQAAEFIPDTPAMWMWGGYDASGTAMLDTVEVYTVTTGEQVSCTVLLVDDDWDFGSPNGGGLPYYTSTLDYLGYAYDMWETDSMGTPPSTTMGTYDVVVWFTGYNWDEAITATEEAELIAYLDDGGNLLVSAEDQFYAQGLTPLFSDYFWVDSYLEDVGLVGTEGNAADPVFAGLGPYEMDCPSQWDEYWPDCPTYDGLYDDVVNVKPGGWEPMIYTDTLEPNSTRFDGGTFKTVYLGYPFEWIADLNDRAEMLDAALQWFCVYQEPGDMQLIPPGQTGSAPPGLTVPYTLTVVNDLGWEESFTLTYNSAWLITAPDSIGPIADGMSDDFVVVVTVPSDANCLDNDLASVMAVAQSDPAYSDTAYIETTADPAGTATIIGTVYDANTGAPIELAFVELWLANRDYTFDYMGWTDANGVYTFTGVNSCYYDMFTHNAVGYVNDYGSMDVMPDMTYTLEIYLDASWPALSEGTVSVSVPVDYMYTHTVDLANNGTGDLHFYVSEIDAASPYVPASVAPMPTGVDAKVYADIEASADGTARFIVYMAEQANLDAAYAIDDWSARGQYVLDTLRETAARTQAGLLAELDNAGVAYESRYIVNAVAVEGDANLVNTLIARPEVAYIGPDGEIPAPEPVTAEPVVDQAAMYDWGITKTQAISVWTDFGVYGDGVIVANIDTGVDFTHEALVQQYRGNMGGSFDHNYNWWDPYGDSPTVPYDWDGHGTHTMGTMVGSLSPTNPLSSTYIIGMAPQANWLACNGFWLGGTGYDIELLECAEFILAPWDLSGTNPMPDLRPHIVNNSWGGGGANWWYNQALYAWRAAGILAPFSAGNAGPGCDSIGSPDYTNTFLVGATFIDDSNAPGSPADFSSRGPTDLVGLLAPNISAPGAQILSSVPGDAYASWGGTSMAAPHVSGLIALIWSAQPELVGDVEMTQWVIEQTADHLLVDQGYFCGSDDAGSMPNNQYGWGRINALNAVDMALNNSWDIDWLDVMPFHGVVAPTDSVALDMAFDATGLMTDTCYTGTLRFDYNDPYVVEELVPVEMCVVECEAITAVDFGWTPMTPTEGMTVTFDAMLVGTPTMPIDYSWDFGDGNMGTGMMAMHIYTATGVYTVTVTASNACSEVMAMHVVTVEPAMVEYRIYLPLITKSF
jgi:subtilisin family serine protease